MAPKAAVEQTVARLGRLRGSPFDPRVGAVGAATLALMLPPFWKAIGRAAARRRDLGGAVDRVLQGKRGSVRGTA
ncbi:hypothetical protein ACIBW9_29615 [Streptomyces sp. NPDC049541]|uniref:hypothetical protein n=1 Tax=Streptomyces sp. NPDC049541 TaxID=3365594 RepID=UPI00378BAB40